MTTTTDAPDASGSPAAAKPSRMAAWRAHSFGPASEQPYRRRTSDWVRLVLGIAILVFAIWHQDDPGDFERNLFTTLNGLPSDLDTFFRLLYALGALWALALVVVAAVVARRWRLARDLAIGGVGDVGARPPHRHARRGEREPDRTRSTWSPASATTRWPSPPCGSA